MPSPLPAGTHLHWPLPCQTELTPLSHGLSPKNKGGGGGGQQLCPDLTRSSQGPAPHLTSCLDAHLRFPAVLGELARPTAVSRRRHVLPLDKDLWRHRHAAQWGAWRELGPGIHFMGR